VEWRIQAVDGGEGLAAQVLGGFTGLSGQVTRSALVPGGQDQCVVDMEHGANPPMLRGTILVAAPPRTVAAALAEPWLVRQSLAPLGVRVRSCRSDQLRAGDELLVELWRLPVRLRVLRADEHGLLMSGVGNRFRVHATVVATGAGTLLTYGVGRAPNGLVLGRRLMLRVVRTMVGAVRERAEQLAGAPVVVGAVIHDGDTVLAAQRDRPPATAGRWEFPGGKVEPGEDERSALARECREELAADVLVDDRVGPDLVLANGWVLRLYLARLAPSARPVAGEHRAIRWVPADRLGDLDWLDADRVVLPGLAEAVDAAVDAAVRAAAHDEVSPGR
jgi:8-oxo-dGTP diphosphatase